MVASATDSRPAGERVADTRPAIERGVEPEHCLSFTVDGPWGHFRRIEGTVAKQTYRVMPRTTVSGLIAAILGFDRDSYYDLFSPESSALAITPVVKNSPIEPDSPFEFRTMNMPTNVLTTKSEARTTLSTDDSKVTVESIDSTYQQRQQANYEVLVDPVYRIDCWLANEEVYTDLKTHLDAGTAHYPTSLGLSEYQAQITYHGEHDVTASEATTVTSAVPVDTGRVVPTPGVNCYRERSPGFMTIDTDTDSPYPERQTTGFIQWAYSPAGEIEVSQGPVSEVNGRAVMFV